MNILEKIIEKTRARVAAQKAEFDFPFESALRKPGLSFICEVKKASPSKGVIAQDFDYKKIASDYAAAGADAVSVLTEPDFFLGKAEYLKEIKQIQPAPVLRKDFIVDEFQIIESRLLGADAVLLIAAALSDADLKKFISLAHSAGMSALVEAHDESEIKKALSAGARIIGVNNRNLKTFGVDLQNSLSLRRLVPPEILFVSESGINTAEDIKLLAENRVDAVLIGETLMRQTDKKAALSELKKLL